METCECPFCHKEYGMDEKYYNTEVECPNCREKFIFSESGVLTKNDFICHFGESLLVTFFSPLFGIIALHYAIMSWEYKQNEEIREAYRYSRKAGNWVFTAWCLYIIFVLLIPTILIILGLFGDRIRHFVVGG